MNTATTIALLLAVPVSSFGLTFAFQRINAHGSVAYVPRPCPRDETGKCQGWERIELKVMEPYFRSGRP